MVVGGGGATFLSGVAITLIKLSGPHILKKDLKVIGDLWEEEGVGGRQEKL